MKAIETELYFYQSGRASCLHACFDAVLMIVGLNVHRDYTRSIRDAVLMIVGLNVHRDYTRSIRDAVLIPQSYWYPILSEGADSVGGQLRGDKECPLSGVTSSSRVRRKMPESDAGNVGRVTDQRFLCLWTGED